MNSYTLSREDGKLSGVQKSSKCPMVMANYVADWWIKKTIDGFDMTGGAGEGYAGQSGQNSHSTHANFVNSECPWSEGVPKREVPRW